MEWSTRQQRPHPPPANVACCIPYEHRAKVKVERTKILENELKV